MSISKKVTTLGITIAIMFGVMMVFLPGMTQAQTVCPLSTNTAYKTANNRSVYYISEDCKKRPIKNPPVFFSYFSSWRDVKITNQDALSFVPDHELGFLPWGNRRNFEEGSVIKSPYDSKVYVILSNKLVPFATENAFLGNGYKWEWVEDVSESVIDKYITDAEISSTQTQPSGTLFKYEDSPEVYVVKLVNGEKQKYHIKSVDELRNLGYRADRIAILSPERMLKDTDTAPSSTITTTTTTTSITTTTTTTQIANCSDLNNNDGTFLVCKDKTLTHVRSGIKVKVNSISSSQAAVSVTQLGYGGIPQTGGYALIFGEETTLATFDNLNIEYKLSASRADDASGKVRITFRTVAVNVVCNDVTGDVDGNQQLCLNKSYTHKDSNIKFIVTKIEATSINLQFQNALYPDTTIFSDKTISQGGKTTYSANGYTLEVSYKGKNVYGQALFGVKAQINSTYSGY